MLGDLRGGAALRGEDDGLVMEPEPFLGEGFGPLLEFFEGVVVLDKHGSGSWSNPEVRSILLSRHTQRKRGARNFRTPY